MVLYAFNRWGKKDNLKPMKKIRFVFQFKSMIVVLLFSYFGALCGTHGILVSRHVNKNRKKHSCTMQY